ncbi:MAG: hypothetical protein KKD30_07120 [Gammaproteobacteria bacterium]|nr:hypothetical protein [Gammaproteobacteria bacterium]MBU0884244.1 hypothetical protein [Gammaproteobacteria bacterium]MBU1859711.1 hypothetical protein [Gammaproteobacteria bacterium]
MSRYLSSTALLIAAALCLALSVALRYQLMEGAQWVGLCVDAPQQLACQMRASLGWLIHFGVLAWASLVCAVLAFVLPGAWGKRLAVPALLLGLPALVLYSASLGVFAVVLALLRWVRAPQTA